METMYLVLGHESTGSGSLTFPEDFDIVGVFSSRREAQRIADQKNQETIQDLDIEVLDGELLEDAINESGEGMVFAVHEVPVNPMTDGTD